MLSGRQRPGVSLIELIVVLAIVGIAAGAITRIATHQQRQYGNMASRSLALAQLRAGADVLVAELAGISPVGGDIHEGGLGRAAIIFRAPLATMVLCAQADTAATEIAVAGVWAVASLAGGDDADVAHDDLPSAGDSILLYDAAADSGRATVRGPWSAHIVTAAAGAPQSCLPGDSTEVAVVRATIDPPVGRPLEAHAPARAFRTARYALYRSANGQWYLGFSDCRPLVRTPVCAPLQPVAGPYMPYDGASSTLGGLVFEYLDAGGAITADRLAVAAVRVTLRANAALPGLPEDTVVVTRSIGLRNSR